MRFVVVMTMGITLALGGCKLKEEAAPDPEATTSATAVQEAVSATAEPAGFAPDSVPESTASLPPFPLFKPLDGLTNTLSDRDSTRAFERDWFVAGTRQVAVEGKLFQGKYNLTLERPYSSLEFRRNYEAAITELGGRKIGGTISTNEVRQQLAKDGARPVTQCMIDPCDETDFYLIRQGGKEWWITIGTGSFPLHGYVVVVEKAGMVKSYAFMDAAALKAALDAKGRVPVYIEFDVDRATIRPAARPAVDEIARLLRDSPALKLSLEGHTDDTGTPARNQPLSLARAEAVRAELIAAGIDPARLKTAGFGSNKPLVPGSSEDARARNRRVELVKLP